MLDPIKLAHPPTEQGRLALYKTARGVLIAERTSDRRKPSEGLQEAPVNFLPRPEHEQYKLRLSDELEAKMREAVQTLMESGISMEKYVDHWIKTNRQHRSTWWE